MRASARKYFVGQPLAVLLGGRSAALPPIDGYDLWLDAADTSTLTITSSAVEQWNDKSGNDYHATQSTSGDRPAYGARTINGITVPNFDGAGDRLVTTAPRAGRPKATFIVMETDTVSGGQKEMIGPTTDGNHFKINGSSLVTTTDGSIRNTYAASLAATTPYVVAQVYDPSATLYMYKNLSSQSFSTADAMNTGGAAIIGENHLNAESWDGAIAEVIQYPINLTTTEAEAVIAHLMAKWGI